MIRIALGVLAVALAAVAAGCAQGARTASPILEKFYLPNAEKIVKAANEILE
jgi:hypothetical protein